VRYVYDPELHGHGCIFDGPIELIDSAIRDMQRADIPAIFRAICPCDWPGRKARTWQDLKNFLGKPWPEATARVKYVQDKCKEGGLPEPMSAKRKGRWSESEGEVDVDRALRGEGELYRQVKRDLVHSPTNIALVTNLDGDLIVNPSGLWFRSTACIAVTDILESLGYSVEVWAWCRGYRVYPAPDGNQFTAVRIKEFGAPVDMDSMCDTLSSWFTTEAVFGAFTCSPVKPISIGAPVSANQNPTSLENSGIGGWLKHLDLSEGVTAIPVPRVRGSLDTAVECARSMLTKIISLQEAGV
jgi:hypothetical protein